MEVVFHLLGKMIVDDPSDMFNVKTSGRQIGRDQEIDVTFAESFQIGPSFQLVHLTAINCTIMALGFEFMGEGVALFTGVGENKRSPFYRLR
jgi:hypothetical protein